MHMLASIHFAFWRLNNVHPQVHHLNVFACRKCSQLSLLLLALDCECPYATPISHPIPLKASIRLLDSAASLHFFLVPCEFCLLPFCNLGVTAHPVTNLQGPPVEGIGGRSSWPPSFSLPPVPHIFLSFLKVDPFLSAPSLLVGLVMSTLPTPDPSAPAHNTDSEQMLPGGLTYQRNFGLLCNL